VPVLFLIAIVVVLVGIFFAATGRGGEMSYEPADHAPLDLGPVSAADVALLRPPTAMWGYNMQVTDEALDQIARAVRERDVTISYLQDRLAGYERKGSYTEPQDAHAHLASDAAETAGEIPWSPESAGAAEPLGHETPEVVGLAGFFEPRETYESPEAYETPETYEPHEAYETHETHEDPGAQASSYVAEPPEAHETSEDPEVSQYSEESEPPETSDTLESPEPPEPPAADLPAAEQPTVEQATPEQAPEQPRTLLVLKASGPKPEPHEATQPSQTLEGPGEADDATEPSAAFRDDEESGETTQPTATLAPDEAPGPQGAFDTHGWWAEQQEAAREEQARRQAPGEHGGDSVAAAEEQGR